MALRATTSTHHAECVAPWASGNGTIVFWFRKGADATSTLGGMVQSSDGANFSGDPRITWGTSTPLEGTVGVNGNGTTNNAHPGPWTAATWQHFVMRWTASGSVMSTIGSAINGTPDAMISAPRNMTTNGTIDKLWLGNPAANVNTYYAYFAYYDYQLSDAQITELQTKYPDAISGTDPIIYCPFLADGNNDGTGGATYDFTLSGATIDATHDGTLPTLSSAPSQSQAPRSHYLNMMRSA